MPSDWIVVSVSRYNSPRVQHTMREGIEEIGGTQYVGAYLAKSDPLCAMYLPFTLPDGGSIAGMRDYMEAEFEADYAILPRALFGRKRLLISDMDSTIIGQECIDELADAVGLKPQISEITERAMRGELDFESALTSRVAMLRGLPLGELERTLRERITLNEGAGTLIATMKKNGAATLLVSGGFTFFTSRVAEMAGFDAHVGNLLADDGAALTGEVGQPILGREAKRTALLDAVASMGISPEDALALGDGANDLDMIRAAGLGVAYKAKPVVAAEAAASIRHTDLRAALFFQGYTASEFVHG